MSPTVEIVRAEGLLPGLVRAAGAQKALAETGPDSEAPPERATETIDRVRRFVAAVESAIGA